MSVFTNVVVVDIISEFACKRIHGNSMIQYINVKSMNATFSFATSYTTSTEVDNFSDIYIF